MIGGKDTEALAISESMKNLFTTSAVARMLGVALQSVSNWIGAGQLRAGRIPGGHRRIAPEDLLDFLRRQGLAIPAELRTSAPKVLVVDDEEAVVSWIAAEIRAERPDIEVLVAQDGFSAGEIVGFERPDVVVLDLRIPGIDGYEVCRRSASSTPVCVRSSGRRRSKTSSDIAMRNPSSAAWNNSWPRETGQFECFAHFELARSAAVCFYVGEWDVRATR